MLACGRNVAPATHSRMIIDISERPSWLLRRGGKAPVQAGEPEAHPAFVGQRDAGGSRKYAKSKNPARALALLNERHLA